MIDSHIHFSNEQYNEDLLEVIETAKESGVTSCIVIGCDKESIPITKQIAKDHPDFMKTAYGCHPINAKEFDDFFVEEIKKEQNSDQFIAIGEIGLDYYWHPEEKEKQKEVFVKQLDLAQELELPIIVHARDSYEDCYEILKKYHDLTGVIHSFSSDAKTAQKFIDLGFKIGLGGPITFKNGNNQKEVAREIDLKNILIETDGPYLTPAPYRGKRNRPEYIWYIAEEIANQKEIEIDLVLEQTKENTKNLFKY